MNKHEAGLKQLWIPNSTIDNQLDNNTDTFKQ